MTLFKMKKIRQNLCKCISLYIWMSILLSFPSCVNDDDFKIPDLTIMEPNLEGNVITIPALQNLFLQEGAALDLADSNLYVEGYVINSDQSGNWFEELIIQDRPSSPTTGLRVLVDDSPLFTFYEVGRKVFIRLDGLYIGESNGVLTLGVTQNLEKIPAPLQFEYITRSPEIAEIIPTPIAIANLSETMENTFIQLTDVQFIKGEVIDANFTFAGEPLDEFDGERTLTSCDDNFQLILSTSTFSDFKSIALPTGRGTIAGTLTRNFFGDTFNLVINSIDAIAFEDIARCDPLEIDCGIAEASGETVLFTEDFETQSPNQPIEGNGWTNYAEAGTEVWEAYSSSSQSVSIGISARVGAFSSGDNVNISWLITPEIFIDTNTGVTLEFLTSNSFADGSNLELLFSSDWDGIADTIPFATWSILSAATIVGDDDNFVTFFNSGLLDLDCISTSGYIAFRYKGSGDMNFDGTYELEGVQIRAN